MRTKNSANPDGASTPDEGAALVSAQGWLAQIPAGFREALLAQCRWRFYAPGEAISTAGDETGGIFGIAAGTVAITTALAPSDSHVIHIGHPGLWFGTNPVTRGLPRNLSVSARTPAYMAYVEQPALERMLAGTPQWWQAIALNSLIAFNIVSNIAGDLMIRDSRRRLVATMLRTANARFDVPSGEPVDSVATQDELANMSNLGRSTTNAILNDLEVQRLVARKYNRVELLDVKALQAILDVNGPNWI
jgi:CRP/FNR family transcriptional regulator, cyclic AMP receptor protein